MAKKKPKKSARTRRSRYREKAATEIHKIEKLELTKVTCKYLSKMDAFQVFLDINLNGVHLRMLGNIDPDHSYDKGIRIFTKCPQPWMTCTEIQLTKDHAPGLFAVLTAYCHTIGDLLDEGMPANKLPQGLVYKDGRKFADSECVKLYRNIRKD